MGRIWLGYSPVRSVFYDFYGCFILFIFISFFGFLILKIPRFKVWRRHDSSIPKGTPMFARSTVTELSKVTKLKLKQQWHPIQRVPCSRCQPHSSRYTGKSAKAEEMKETEKVSPCETRQCCVKMMRSRKNIKAVQRRETTTISKIKI